MQIILLERVMGLGKIGDSVPVKNGYARNFLLPQQKALVYSEDNYKHFETMREELEATDAKKNADATEIAEKLKDSTIKIESLANAEGKLFGSIGTAQIAKLLTEKNILVSRQQILMPHGPIKEVGTNQIIIRLHQDITTSIVVEVVSPES